MTYDVRAVLFDLDDTLFEQASWLAGAWVDVATAAQRDGVDRARFLGALHRVCNEGSDRGEIIDRALTLVGRSDVAVAPLLTAFRGHTRARLAPFPGVIEALDSLRGRVALGLVTDGDPVIQRAKLRALGLESAFEVVVLGDELGREHRKPSPVGLLAALVALGVDASSAVFIGDRPSTDVAAADAAGMRAIRVRTGEYARESDTPRPWATAPDAARAVDGLLRIVLAPTRERAQERLVAVRPARAGGGGVRNGARQRA
jgi:putative hydrolase of the HAD superfamily